MAARGQTFLRLLGNGAKAWPTDEFVWRFLSWSQIWSHLGSFAAVLHFRDNYTLAEVADIIGSTTAAVGVHLYRARRRLRELLGEDDD